MDDMQPIRVPRRDQRRIPAPNHRTSPHARLKRSPNLPRIIAQKQPLLGLPVRIFGQDGPVARGLGLRARGRGVEIVC